MPDSQIPYIATCIFDNETRIIRGYIDMSGGMEEAIREEKEQQELQFKSRVRDQKPTTNLVIEDIQQRHEMGLLKYGKSLSARTDEDMLQHLYEELLDASMYIKTLIIQRQQERRKEIQRGKEKTEAFGRLLNGRNY